MPPEDYDPFDDNPPMEDLVPVEDPVPAPEPVIPVVEEKPLGIWDHPLTFRTLQKYLERISDPDIPIIVFDMQSGGHRRLYAVDSPSPAIDPKQEFYCLFTEPIEVGPPPF